MEFFNESPIYGEPQPRDDERMVMPTCGHALEMERLGDHIAQLSAHLDAASARLLDLIREFDVQGGWANGFNSCAAWLSWRVGLDLGAARERVRVARALGTLPLLAGALARGELSYAKVRALTRVATPETEARLLAVGRAGTAVDVERIVRGWRRIDRQAEGQEAARLHANRALHVHQDDDGTVIVRGRLDPEAGAVFMRALEAARETLYQRRRQQSFREREEAGDLTDRMTEPPAFPQQQADALVLVAESALAHGMDPGAAAERYQVVVHVDAAVLVDADQPGQSLLDDGVGVSAETSQRLACDASRVLMRHDAEGRVTEVSARSRAIPAALRRALQHRDRGCRFPGCHVRVTQGHHIRHWAAGGPTTLSNLVLLCRAHHRAVHEEGYTVARESNGALQFTRPNGWPFPQVPAVPATPAEPVTELEQFAEEHDFGIGPDSLRATDGGRFDLGWALDVLHPLSNPLQDNPAPPNRDDNDNADSDDDTPPDNSD